MGFEALTISLMLAGLASQTQSVDQSAQRHQPDALVSLTFRSGWVILGTVTPDGHRWSSGFDSTAGFMTGVYEIVGSDWDRRRPRLPKPGERIRLTGRSKVFILDYAVSGEQRRLDSPASLQRGLTDADFTGLYIEAGTILEVKAADVWQLPKRLKAIWARVEPVPDK